MHFRAIKMYGVKESWITPGKKSFGEICTENDEELRDYRMVIDGIIVPIHFDLNEVDNCFGFEAEYPWDYRGLDLQDLQDYHIKRAIGEFLKQYGFDYKEVLSAVDYISDADTY